MNIMNSYRILFFLFFIIFYHPLIAQDGVSIKASVDKNKILLGEPLKLSVEITVPEKKNFLSPSVDSIAHFEFLQPSQSDSIFEGGSKAIKTVYSITSFDSGQWVIPAFVLSPKIKSEPIIIDVVFSDFNPQQDYHDIKDIIEVKPKEDRKDWLWYAIAATAVALLLMYFLLKKRKQPAPPAPAQVINAYEEAMRELKDLQQKRMTGKEFHSRLVDIFKLYILRKKNILSLQKTTDDLVMQLRNIIADKESYSQLQQALRLSDFVKFAKYNPSPEDDNNAFDSIKKTIQYIEQNT